MKVKKAVSGGGPVLYMTHFMHIKRMRNSGTSVERGTLYPNPDDELAALRIVRAQVGLRNQHIKTSGITPLALYFVYSVKTSYTTLRIAGTIVPFSA